MSNRFHFSSRSLNNLADVHPDLRLLAERVLGITDIDFTVLEGRRSIEKQRELVQTGASLTMNSRHLTGHAIDIAPYINGGISWHWPHYYQLMTFVRSAAVELGIPVRWGGVWDRKLNDLKELDQEVGDYVMRKKSAGQRAFLDGPHIELCWQTYPKE